MQCTHQIKALPRNILILIDQYVAEVETLFIFLISAEQSSRLVDHILKIDRIGLLKIPLIFDVHIPGNAEKEPAADIVRTLPHPLKVRKTKAVRLKIHEEPADENDEPIFVGRFNIGVVSLHLPMILAKAREEERDFYEVLDEYLSGDLTTNKAYVIITSGQNDVKSIPRIVKTLPNGYTGIYGRIVKYYTVPNGEKGVKYQIISL